MHMAQHIHARGPSRVLVFFVSESVKHGRVRTSFLTVGL